VNAPTHQPWLEKIVDDTDPRYVKEGRMTGGFALIAWPATYGSSGIMAFQVNQDGAVFQKDLGANTPRIVGQITRFDPDLGWTLVDVTNQ
jgi:hypothetical protein